MLCFSPGSVVVAFCAQPLLIPNQILFIYFILIGGVHQEGASNVKTFPNKSCKCHTLKQAIAKSTLSCRLAFCLQMLHLYTLEV